MGSMLVVVLSRDASQSPLFMALFYCLMVSVVAQLVLVSTRPAVHNAWRHQLAWANRVARILVLLVPMRRHYDIAGRLLPTHHHTELASALFSVMCVLPLTQFYGSLCFVLPAASTMLVQLLATMVISSILKNSYPTLSSLPGMDSLGDKVCLYIRGVFELVLHVVVDQAAMPGVHAAGFDAFGLPSRCHGQATFAQLLLYGSLTFGFFLPFWFTYVVELRHKLQFWRNRHVCVQVQRSPLLPMPGSPFVSHLTVLLSAQLLLWFLAELLVPLLL